MGQPQMPAPNCWESGRTGTYTHLEVDKRQTVKTDRRGWYLNRRRSLAIGDDGAYLRLVIPDVGTFARFTGVKITPELPPLMVAANGKDGEGLSLIHI